MTPAAFAKLLLRLGATAFLSLTVLPRLPLMLGALRMWRPGIARSDMPGLSMLLTASALMVLLAVATYGCAGYLARFFLPRDSDPAPDPRYPQYEQAGFLLIGGFCLLKAALGFDIVLLGNYIAMGDPLTAPIYLALAIFLIFGLPGLIADAARRAFGRARH